MSRSSFILLSLLPLLVTATNDWSKPCLDGWCSYDVPTSGDAMAGTITISGSSHAISDITPAAGWEVLNCTADTDAQDIRIVCSGDEASCSQLFENGAEHTVVRLPEGCGSIPFARVTSCEESGDQSLPENVKARIVRRDGTTPSVHALSFDAKFDEVPASQHGNVSMLVYGSTIPGFAGNATITAAGSRRRSRLVNKRGFFDSLLGDFNETKQTNLPPINIDQSFKIFNTTLSCSTNEEAQLSVDVNAKVDANVTIGAVLAGSLIPPKISEFGLFSDMSADLDGGLSINANIAGQVDTGKIPLFTVGLPGLSIPGILSLGPSFEIDAQALATIDLDVTMDVDLAYSFSDLQLFFPPSDGQSSNAVVAPKDTPLKLSVSPSVQSNATLEAHLIPTLKFGLSAFGNNADVFLDLDTFAALDLGLIATADGSVNTAGTTGASADFGGCVDVNGGVSVNAGADASFFGLFDPSTQVALFSKNFDFFKKCFTESASTTSPASVSATSSASIASNSISGDRGLSASATSQATRTALSSSVSFDPDTSTSSFLSSVGSSSSFALVSSTALSSSFPLPSTTDGSASVSSSTRSSGAPNVEQSGSSTSGKNRRRRHVSRSSHGQSRALWSPVTMSKRAFQCLPADVSAAVSIVDQTLSSSSFA